MKCFHIPFRTIGLIFLLPCSYAHPISGENYLSAQIISSINLNDIKNAYTKLKKFTNVRIERRENYLVLRVGYWDTQKEANQHLRLIQRDFSKAYIRIASFQPDLILEENSNQKNNYKEKSITPAFPYSLDEELNNLMEERTNSTILVESTYPRSVSAEVYKTGIEEPYSSGQFIKSEISQKDGAVKNDNCRGWLELEPRLIFDHNNEILPANLRGSAEFHCDYSLTLDRNLWRMIIANRVDHLITKSRLNNSSLTRNNLKEAFFSSQHGPLQLDFGRINEKYGNAVAGSPVDFFKRDAIANRISEDPQVLQNSRLGTAMVRLQLADDWGGASLALSPALHKGSIDDSANGFNFRLDRTNRRERAVLRVSPTWGNDWAQDFFLLQEADRPLLFGTSFSHSLGQASVLYFDWAAGKRPSLEDDAIEREGNGPTPTSFIYHTQYVLGATMTTSNNITFRLEALFNGAADDSKAWSLRRRYAFQNPAVAQVLGIMRAYSLESNEPLTQHAWFFSYNWVDYPFRDVDLNGFIRGNKDDGSKFFQLGGTWRIDSHTTWAILFTGNSGKIDSELGYGNIGKSFQMIFTRFF